MRILFTFIFSFLTVFYLTEYLEYKLNPNRYPAGLYWEPSEVKWRIGQ